MKWLKNLDRKLESAVNQFDRAAAEPVRKILTGEVFTNDPGSPVLYGAAADTPEPDPDLVIQTDTPPAPQRVTTPRRTPAGETA